LHDRNGERFLEAGNMKGTSRTSVKIATTGAKDRDTKKLARVSDLPFELSARAARVQLEDTFPERFRALIDRAGCTVDAVADQVGVGRENLYKYFSGYRVIPAAWLSLVPPSLRLLYLQEEAADLGYTLTDASDAQPANGTLCEMIASCSQVMRIAAESESDGEISVAEAERELVALVDLHECIRDRREFLRGAIEQRGVVVGLKKKVGT
jgi:transcriptional regulator with XRE-family HTH domain